MARRKAVEKTTENLLVEKEASTKQKAKKISNVDSSDTKPGIKAESIKGRKCTKEKLPVEKPVEIVDNFIASVDSPQVTENNTQNRLTFMNDDVDIRYGMLLHYFPKGGILHLPSGTCETGYYVAANKHITKIHFPNSMETIGHGSFFHCEDLTSLMLSDNITSIAAMAFCECKNLCEIVFNAGLKEIGRKAFAGCKALSGITIPKSVSYIGPEAFKDCINLVYVRMPQKTQLAPTAFDNCHIDLKFEYY